MTHYLAEISFALIREVGESHGKAKHLLNANAATQRFLESDYSAALRDTFEKFQTGLTHMGAQITDLKKSRTKMAGKIQDLEDTCETAVKRAEYNQQMESIQNWTREIVRKEIGDLQSNVSNISDKIA
jgi:predicted  nucleic acid-binding Zn-ribbon protein